MQSDLGKLFIGGISWETNEEHLKDYFSAFGEVVEAVIMKDQATGRARGFGFVVFADPAVAEIVIREKHNIDGRMVEAKKAVPRDDQSILSRTSGSIHGSPGPGRSRKIFVGGLASTVTEEDFKKYFEQFGAVTDVVVMYDHNTNRPRGFGFITYDSEEAVDRVLVKTFHELNGKKVEVKRAVPKELSPGPSRTNQYDGYSYGRNRVNNILHGYRQGYNPNTIGGYGVRMDGRFSSLTSGQSGLPPVGLAYGLGMNFEPGLNFSYGGGSSFNSSLSYGRGVNPFFVGNSNRIANPIGYDGGNVGNSSFFSSASRNLWGNGSPTYGSNSSTSNSLVEAGGSLRVGTFGSNQNWGAPGDQGLGNAGSNSANMGYGSRNADVRYGLGGASYGRYSGGSAAMTSSPLNGEYNRAFSDFYDGGSIYGDMTWKSSAPEQDRSNSFGYGLGNSSADVFVRDSSGDFGGYSVDEGQSNRGYQ